MLTIKAGILKTPWDSVIPEIVYCSLLQQGFGSQVSIIADGCPHHPLQPWGTVLSPAQTATALPTRTPIPYLSSPHTSEVLGGMKHELLGGLSAEVGMGFELQVSASHREKPRSRNQGHLTVIWHLSR